MSDGYNEEGDHCEDCEDNRVQKERWDAMEARALAAEAALGNQAELLVKIQGAHERAFLAVCDQRDAALADAASIPARSARPCARPWGHETT